MMEAIAATILYRLGCLIVLVLVGLATVVVWDIANT